MKLIKNRVWNLGEKIKVKNYFSEPLGSWKEWDWWFLDLLNILEFSGEIFFLGIFSKFFWNMNWEILLKKKFHRKLKKSGTLQSLYYTLEPTKMKWWELKFFTLKKILDQGENFFGWFFKQKWKTTLIIFGLKGQEPGKTISIFEAQQIFLASWCF